jgi:hypothetical protein
VFNLTPVHQPQGRKLRVAMSEENGIQTMMRINQEQSEELAGWRWLAEMRLTVQENSVVGRPPWAVLDVDGEILGEGATAQAAIENARSFRPSPGGAL